MSGSTKNVVYMYNICKLVNVNCKLLCLSILIDRITCTAEATTQLIVVSSPAQHVDRKHIQQSIFVSNLWRWCGAVQAGRKGSPTVITISIFFICCAVRARLNSVCFTRAVSGLVSMECCVITIWKSSITVQDFCCVAEQCTILFSNICIVQRISQISTEDWNELTANGNKLIERRWVQKSGLSEDCSFYYYSTNQLEVRA